MMGIACRDHDFEKHRPVSAAVDKDGFRIRPRDIFKEAVINQERTRADAARRSQKHRGRIGDVQFVVERILRGKRADDGDGHDHQAERVQELSDAVMILRERVSHHRGDDGIDQHGAEHPPDAVNDHSQDSHRLQRVALGHVQRFNRRRPVGKQPLVGQREGVQQKLPRALSEN